MKTSLKEKSSLPLSLQGNRLVFGRGIMETVPDIRTIAQMKPVLLDQALSAPEECYYMYRDTHLEKDSSTLKESGMRYDITVVPSLFLGEEYNKTFGHFHPYAKGSALTYPEVYEVIHGVAHYVLQPLDNSRFIVFEAKPGDKVLIPPNFGHITINPGKECLVMSNWVYADFKSEYGVIGEKKGGMYYETKKGWLKNANYQEHPEIEFKRPFDIKEFGLLKSRPMYKLVSDQGKLEFLRYPQNHAGLLASLL